MSKNTPVKLYHHKTDGGAEYLCSSRVPGTQEGSCDAAYIVRLDGTPEIVRTPAPKLLAALEGLLVKYVDLANANQAGHWSPKMHEEVIAARAAIEEAR